MNVAEMTTMSGAGIRRRISPGLGAGGLSRHRRRGARELPFARAGVYQDWPGGALNW